jgi:type IV pilus assembly protein PilM
MGLTLSRPVRRRQGIGLDIGSSAVRAAEVVVDGKGSQLVRFAQVGLPTDAVVEGEVRDRAAVALALKRLWDEGGFSGRSVVLGVSSQRAMVRVIEMPAIEGKELRSALRYEIGELLPIPVEQAVYDYAVLGPGRPSGDGGVTLQVLLLVAQKDIVRDEIAVVGRAGLRVRAVDASPLALLRAVPAPEEDDALDAVVSLGAQLVVVAIREGGVPRFMRTATVAAESEEVVHAGVGTHIGAAEGREGRPRGNGAKRVDPVLEEVRSSIEYFLSHAQGATLARVQLTGGGARMVGLAERLAATLGIPVVAATLAPSYERLALGLDDEQLKEASWRWTTAAGLALWGSGTSAHAPSLVPPEIAERARARRVMAGAGAGVVLAAGGLGMLSHSRVGEINNARTETKVDQQEATRLQAEIFKLQSLGTVQSEVLTRRNLAVEALANDIDWVGLDGRIVKALPGGVRVTQVSFSTSPPQVPPQGSSPASKYVGQVTITADTTGGLPSIASFVRAMTRVRGLAAVWVASTNSASQPSGGAGVRNAFTQSLGEMQFSASAEVTNAALSKRAEALPGGAK